MANSNDKQVQMLPRPETDQASGGIIDLDAIGEYLTLAFNYPQKASGQQVDFTVSIKPDRFTPPMSRLMRLTTQNASKEEVHYKTSQFHFTTEDGTLTASYEAKIDGRPYPSIELLLRVKDRVKS
ncbi:hypothetical protein LOY70_04400 [Pseudomonas sp. B21-054]|uniref:hypothetical protein n=1 Tax=Pseudomonas sp. B21-054 TaxID=2895494 RepID=UPI0022321FDD|nr:hypothetical protein [Pseudomonas sp. B21-054]UZE18843.1 hypothetical protein LOY70_04400 [Pseudomonas sp. B21-054]